MHMMQNCKNVKTSMFTSEHVDDIYIVYIYIVVMIYACDIKLIYIIEIYTNNIRFSIKFPTMKFN